MAELERFKSFTHRVRDLVQDLYAHITGAIIDEYKNQVEKQSQEQTQEQSQEQTQTEEKKQAAAAPKKGRGR